MPGSFFSSLQLKSVGVESKPVVIGCWFVLLAMWRY